MKWSHVIHPGDWLMTSWGIAVAIVLVIDMMQPRRLAKVYQRHDIYRHRRSRWYDGRHDRIFLSVDGGRCCHRVIGGGYVYARTPAGKPLGFPSAQFFQYLCAKGLPAVVTVSIIGIAVMLWIIEQHPVATIQYM